MSLAYASTLDISFEVRGGLLMRQVHHWSALLFVAAAGLHMLRVFFTGAFRKPREINWVVGFVLFVLGMAGGFTGYSLPDDRPSFRKRSSHYRRNDQGSTGYRCVHLFTSFRW
ncbi:MAG: hypothetical protein RL351_1067 [Actinomycetota bacterium]